MAEDPTNEGLTDDDRRTALEVLRGSRILAYTVGLLCVAAGVVLMFWPDRTLIVVARIAGIFVLALGLSEVFDAVTTHRKGSYWGLLLLRGALNVVAGALLLFWPSITVTVLVWLFGLDLVITGIIGLFASREIPKDMGRSVLVARSAVGIVFGIVLIVWPDVTLQVLAILIGLQLLAVGAILLFSGYQLTKISHDV
jgi:uncharacterized membrane protein HdeD (DUF308 family)